MKNGKTAIAVLVIAFCAAASLSAQSWGPGMMRGMMPNNMMPMRGNSIRNIPMIEKMTLKGNLVAVEGRIALKASDGKTYYVRGIQSLIGFVDGLKEGASVEIEGGVQKFTAADNTEIDMLYAEKLTIGGKVYDKLLSQPTTAPASSGKTRLKW